ncbi:glutathione-disulfide reductase [Salinarimonas ramus]|uniref:Glutathione reductase n=1 Tax=Salinarimonas ramus TaxID=690164 RepID=A0A917V5R7_9HYPH|nr:glutathione-disulfide reductase [Salinarimonas ramus]GGK40583.1 glutathione-disulfide reductase [Salinarimonas ramus]
MAGDFDLDLFVIGGGSGGVRAARIAAGYGAKVAIAEEYRYGGTCVIRGCVPKKLMVLASRFADDFADAAGYGWSVGETAFDWQTLVANKEREITRLEGVYRANLERAGVRLLEGRAVIEGPHAVRLLSTGEVFRARHILVAVGARPSLEPMIPGGELGITSNEIFDIPEQPKRILVVGGGYIGVEFAGIFAGLGSKVTMSLRGDKLLRGFDEDLRDRLGAAYSRKGVDLRFGTTLERLARRPDGAVDATFQGGDTAVFDRVLVATGRRPNTADLGLETAGVALDAGGAIVVDGYSRTLVPSISAVGDVTNRAALTPVAIREGHAFADTVFGDKPAMVDHELIPTAVFSTPEIGTVGCSETLARSRSDDVAIYETSFRSMRATLSGRDDPVYMKLVVDAKSDRVMGVHLFGRDSGEMIQLAGIAVTMGATKADFDRTIAVHPTAAEELVTMRTRAR